jgi:hypothetical protein
MFAPFYSVLMPLHRHLLNRWWKLPGLSHGVGCMQARSSKTGLCLTHTDRDLQVREILLGHDKASRIQVVKVGWVLMCLSKDRLDIDCNTCADAWLVCHTTCCVALSQRLRWWESLLALFDGLYRALGVPVCTPVHADFVRDNSFRHSACSQIWPTRVLVLTIAVGWTIREELRGEARQRIRE